VKAEPPDLHEFCDLELAIEMLEDIYEAGNGYLWIVATAHLKDVHQDMRERKPRKRSGK
jgi:hypothetical protein